MQSDRRWYWVQFRHLGWHHVNTTDPRSMRLPFVLGCGKVIEKFSQDAPHHRLFVISYSSRDVPPTTATDVCERCAVHFVRKVDDVPN